jgi:hypothetical protein
MFSQKFPEEYDGLSPATGGQRTNLGPTPSNTTKNYTGGSTPSNAIKSHGVISDTYQLLFEGGSLVKNIDLLPIWLLTLILIVEWDVPWS